MKGNSWLWKGFVEGVNFINEKVGEIFSNGENISVWNCKWIPYKNGLRKPYSSMINLGLKVKDLWTAYKIRDTTARKDYFDNPIDIENIGKIYLSRSLANDEKVWPLSKNGLLTTKSAYRLISSRNQVSFIFNGKIESFVEDSSPPKGSSILLEMSHKCCPDTSHFKIENYVYR
eukprot:TRINITY_DN8973_c0_g1_i2.p1 TRINITY_DN8973_c0_g1~~TRINITY_DN8973_c0_g1_i2.p1  ORF type:complete len:174 (+),score=14.40 TRINITY_DN8973_c0_g1_i2:967-1488(+)